MHRHTTIPFAHGAKVAISLAGLAALVLFLPPGLMAQRDRVTGLVNNRNRVMLRGHIHPKADSADDQGRVSPSLVLPYVTLELKPSASQQAELEKLLEQQQDPTSANFHRWLSPEEYADRFGVSQDDLNKLVAWLKGQNLTIATVARGRNFVAVSGMAAQIENAFGTEIHQYRVNGEVHFANATEPTIPAAFQTVVSGIRGLHDFRLRPAVAAPRQVHPNQTSARGNHYLGPDDFAAIYNTKPLYTNGIDGSGQKVAIAGQTQIDVADIQQFRSNFNLPANTPQVMLVPNSTDPGILSGDLTEADLDVEWAGAVARNATVYYVYADDVMVAAHYAIDQNVAPVLSISYGLCELQTSPMEAATMQSWARQANAQGITWIAASGDAGGADCVTSSSRNSSGLSVDIPAGIPEVTGIGGTEFSEGTGTYWNATNDSNQASALSYIPEMAWNDSIADREPSASGGGASTVFAKPSWQAGAGVPNDGARDVPDVSLSGSANHDGYLIFSSGNQQVVGGTSAGAPSFAGIAALINHYLVSSGAQTSAGLGNMNARLYRVAQTNPNAFHDITVGDNIVTPCSTRVRLCTATPIGYSTGPGYDQVTGLGSVDAYNLVMAWRAGAAVTKGTATMVLSATEASVPVSGSTVLTATVKAINGGIPTGTVTFNLGNSQLGAISLVNSNGTATASLTLNAANLPLGTANFTAQYSGDFSYDGATASTSITVTAVNSGTPSITLLENAASFQQVYAPGMILSVFGKQLAPTTATYTSAPLPAQLAGVTATVNGVTAPLYYVSATQINLQIPYGVTPNAKATLTINNNGQTASTALTLASAAPGVFMNASGAPVPNTSAARGQTITMYITGDGALSPAVLTGSGPAAGTPVGNLPKPVQAVSVTVGGVAARTQFIGVPGGYVGVTQINYQVPLQAPLGAQRVVVTVGGIASAPATLTVTQ